MGNGRIYKCKKCGNEFEALLGFGMAFPSVYEDTMKQISNGKYGEEWRELLDSIPCAAIDAEEHLYKCNNCGNWSVEMGLGIYAPNNLDNILNKRFGIKTVEELGYTPYVTDRELRRDYHFVKNFIHNCPECGKRMRKTDNMRALKALKCPRCGELTECMPENVCWD